jgi:hypothetical protein
MKSPNEDAGGPIADAEPNDARTTLDASDGASDDPTDTAMPQCREDSVLVDCAHVPRAQCVDGTCSSRPRPTAPASFGTTSGGTLATSPQHRLRMFIAMPPAGASSTDDHRLTLGASSVGVPSTAP